MARLLVLGALGLLAAAGVSADPSKPPTFVGNGMGAVGFLRFSPNGKELARVCQFSGPEIFDTARYDTMRTFETGGRMLAFSPDGTVIGTADGIDGARVWDATLPGKSLLDATSPSAPLREVRVFEVPLRVLQTPSSLGRSSLETRADMRRVLCAEFSPDGKRFLTAQAGGQVKVWNTRTWATESELVTGVDLMTMVFAPDGKTIVVGDHEGMLHEWSLELKKEVKTMRTTGAVVEIVFAPDGNSFATVHVSPATHTSMSTSVVFWDRERKIVETKDGWSSVAISKDGKTMAIGGKRVDFLDPSSRKTIRTVDLPAMTLRESNPGLATVIATTGVGSDHDSDTKVPVVVTALAFSPDGALLAAGCQDGTIRLLPTAP